MLKISSISFKGIDKKQPVSIDTSSVDSNYRELGEGALPVGNRSLTVNPAPPSDFLDETDLEKYRNVQREWAGSVAKKFGIPLDNVLVRLPEIRLGDARQMINMNTHTFAEFSQFENVVNVIPVREIANLHGGADVKVVHESLHGFLHNLRRAWAKRFTIAQLYEGVTNMVANKMLKGEHGLIIKGFPNGFIDDPNIEFKREVMYAPTLSKEERKELVRTIYSLQPEHLDTKKLKLTEAGRDFVRTTLLPKLTVYSQCVADPSEDKRLKGLTDYMEAIFPRRDLLFCGLGSPYRRDLERSIQTPLTKVEEELVSMTLDSLLACEEETYISQFDSSGLHMLYDTSVKAYFMSYEEIVARCEENLYRRAKVQEKIAGAIGKGLIPGANLLEEQRVVANNLTLLNQARLLGIAEEQMIAADKDPQKMREINSVRDKITQYMEGSKKMRLSEMWGLIDEMNNLDSPEKLLAETPENAKLTRDYYTILKTIRALATECDLMSIPEQFFSSKEDFIRAGKKNEECIAGCFRRLKL